MRGDSPGVAGDIRRALFQALIAAHTSTLEVVAKSLCRDPALAADLVQDTFERAWRRLNTLRDEERARAWLVQIMRRTWIDHLRRRRKEVSLDESHEPTAPEADEPSWWERVTVQDLRWAIEQLKEPFRSAAIMHDLDGQSYRDIARTLGIPNATAATRIHRAHSHLRELLRRKLGVAEPAQGSGEGSP